MSEPYYSTLNEDELRRAIASGSKDVEHYRNMAAHLVRVGQHSEAALYYQQAFELPLSNHKKADLCIEFGWLLLEEGQFGEAKTLAQNAIDILSAHSETTETLVSRGAAYALLASYELAIDHVSSVNSARAGLKALERAIAEGSDPNTKSLAHYFAARLHIILGSADKAVTLCKQCLERELGECERVKVQLTLIEALRSQERFEEAETAIVEALQCLDTSKLYERTTKRLALGLVLERGLIQRLSNRFEDAVKTFKQILVDIEADPLLRNSSDMSGRVWWDLAAVLFESSDYQQAAAAYDKALLSKKPEEPDHYRILLSLGDCYLGTGSRAKAQDFYEKVLASPHGLDVEKLNARAGIGKVLYESREYEKAASHFEALLPNYRNDDPNYYTSLLWLGSCYEGMWIGAKARNCYEDILAAPYASETDKASARQALTRLVSSRGSQTFH